MLALVTVAIVMSILMPVLPIATAALVALALRTTRRFGRRSIGRCSRDDRPGRAFGGLRSADIRPRTITVTSATAPMLLVGAVALAVGLGGLADRRSRAVVGPVAPPFMMSFLAR